MINLSKLPNSGGLRWVNPLDDSSGPKVKGAVDRVWRVPRVEFLFFPGCPHIEAARAQLRRALEQVGLPVTWVEHDVTLASTPAALQGYGSPTVLVDGADVVGAPPGDGVACRLYLDTEVPGAPPLKALLRALSA